MSDMKKIYIAGAGGMLGEAFHKVFKDQYELKCSYLKWLPNGLPIMWFDSKE